MRVAVLSDTHGLLRPRVLDEARGCELILHAGDVGDPGVLAELRRIAPVLAVRGNVDVSGELARLPSTIGREIAGLAVRMTHRREDVSERWYHEADVVVFGHSHRPELEWRGARLLLNPGAVGQRRFKLPLTMARLTVHEGRLVPEIIAVE
jgi:hypothetical protein